MTALLRARARVVNRSAYAVGWGDANVFPGGRTNVTGLPCFAKVSNNATLANHWRLVTLVRPPGKTLASPHPTASVSYTHLTLPTIPLV